ncbi:MAG: hypothetical protein KUG65_12870 [Sphingomonadaceae bacterium]|nr:hypothetical protein [Sphingomonadaceae bacterium]
MTESVDAGLPLRRAFVRIGGKPIVHHQLEIALSFGCERVICMVKSLDSEVIAMQHMTEDAGSLFHTASTPQELSGLVAANDELIVFSEGLLADPERARQMLEMGMGVFVQPVETGLAAGFERLDINHASAGLLRISGHLIEGLVQLAPDCEVPSALTRIALQAGVAMREVPAEARSGMRWQVIRSETDASAIEHDWLAQQLGNPRIVSPGRWIARQGVMAFGSALLHAGNASAILIIAMLVAMAIALGFAWLDSMVTGFLFCALGWIFHRAARLLRRIEVPLATRDGRDSADLVALEWALDLELMLFVLWASGTMAEQDMILQAFAPVLFVLLVRLVPQLLHSAGSAWLGDRAVLSVILALIAGLGGMIWFVRVGALAFAAAAIAISRSRSG